MFYLGIDVSKAKLDCCLLLDAARTKRKSKSVANRKAGIVDLLEWTAKQGVQPVDLHAVMEGTCAHHQLQQQLRAVPLRIPLMIVNALAGTGSTARPAEVCESMPYKVPPTVLPEALILKPKVFGDDRGFFFESFNQRDSSKPLDRK